VLIGLSVITQLIYPIEYAKLVNVGWYTFPMTLLLALRNVLLVWLAYLACAQVWRLTRTAALPEREPTSE
jgi:hypothetical protein